MPVGRRVFKNLIATSAPLRDPTKFQHLELYLDSRLGINGVADGGLLGEWIDQSGHSPTRDAITAGGVPAFTDPTFWVTTAGKLSPKGKPTVEWGLTTAFPGNALVSRATFPWPDMTVRGYTFHFYGRIQTKTTPLYPFVNQAWFGPTNKIASFAGQNLFDTGTGPAPGRSIGLVDISGGGNPHQFTSLATIANQWHHHTIIWPTPINNTVPMKYYIDGVEQAQVAGPANFDMTGGVGNVFYSLGNLWNGNVVTRGLQGWCAWYSDTHNLTIIKALVRWSSIIFGF